jgi:SMC interacting uncharacterized protein involved in chromosome segregation
MKCTLDEDIKALRHKIFEIQDAKSRMTMRVTTLMKHYNIMRQRARRLEEGYECEKSYATWTKEQMSNRRE